MKLFSHFQIQTSYYNFSLSCNIWHCAQLLLCRLKHSFKFLIWLSCIILYTKVICQSNKINSDSVLIFNKLDLADEQDFRGQIDSAITTIEWIIQQSLKKNFTRGLGYAQLKKADLFLKKSEYSQIESLLNEAYLIGTFLNDSLMMGLAHTQRSQYKGSKGDYESSISSLQKAIECFSPIDHLYYIGIAYNDIAFGFAKLSDLDKSIDYGFQALRIFEQLDDKKETANTLNNIGVNYFKINDKERAIEIFKKSLSIQNEIGDIKRIVSTLGNLVIAYSKVSLDSAIFYKEISVVLVDKLGAKSAQANSYSQTASLYEQKKDHQKSLYYFQKALQLFKEMEAPGKIATASINCAVQISMLHDSTAAEVYFDNAIEKGILSKDKSILQSFHIAKSNFYQSLNNNSLALQHYKKSIEYKDSIINDKTNEKIAELEIQYQTEKKELQLINANQEQKRKDAEIDVKNKQLSIAKLLQSKNEQDLVLIAKEKELQNVKINELNFENTKKDLVNKTQMQNVQLLEIDNQLKQKLISQKNLQIALGFFFMIGLALIAYLVFNRYKLKKQIEERKEQDKIRDKIARDLHDEIGSSLTSIHLISLSTERKLEENPDQSKSSLHEIQAQSKKIQQNMSDIVWALGSENDKIESLFHRMKEFAVKILEAKDIRVMFDADSENAGERLGIEQRKELLLICKEMINNVIRHSKATEVILELKKTTDGIKLAVIDNGTGFKEELSTGTGLKSMKERAAKIGGRFDLFRNNHRTIAQVIIP